MSNSMSAFLFIVGHHVGHLVYLHESHHVQLDVDQLLFVGHHVDHLVGHHVGHLAGHHVGHHVQLHVGHQSAQRR